MGQNHLIHIYEFPKRDYAMTRCGRSLITRVDKMNTLRYLAVTIHSRKPISRSSYDESGAHCVYRVLIIFKTAHFNMEMKSSWEA